MEARGGVGLRRGREECIRELGMLSSHICAPAFTFPLPVPHSSFLLMHTLEGSGDNSSNSILATSVGHLWLPASALITTEAAGVNQPMKVHLFSLEKIHT